MPSSKVDYLSKYLDGDKKTKKEKKKKKKRRKEHAVVEVREEEDDALPPPVDPEVLEQEEDEEERPVVVEGVPDGDEDGERQSSRGMWSEVATGNNHHTQNPNSNRDAGQSRRRRYDSSSSEEKVVKQRYDSSEEEDTSKKDSRKRRRHDSDDDGSEKAADRSSGRKDDDTRRKRYDSSSDDDDKEPKRKRYDSSDDDGHDKKQDKDRRRSRHDSDSESERDKGKNSKERTRSGHLAGLQTGATFRKTESSIQEKRSKAAKHMVDKYGMGETVYRDKMGRKVDKPVVDDNKGRPTLDPEQQRLLNMGAKQQQALAQESQVMAALEQSTFARHADDSQLEDLRKQVIRPGDPMAAQAAQKTQSSGSSLVQHQRPVYKGPPPKPNRFGIRPGYRWDGIDRGNGFEDRLLALRFSAKHKQEQAYRWSTADM